MFDGELAPLTGMPDELSGRSHDASRASAVLGEARASLRHVHAALSGQRSTAVTAAAVRLTSVDERLVACTTVLDGAATTLRRHARVLADLQADARLALVDRDAALARERRWQAEVDEARRSTWNAAALGSGMLDAAALGSTALGSTALGSAAPGDDPHLRLVTAERQLAAARADVAAAEARWRAARDAKGTESRRAAAALGSFTDVRAVRVASASGMSAAQFRESASQGQRAVALLPSAILADEPADRREARADLRALLTNHRDDPAFWAMFWDDATPQQVYLALGVDPADPGDPLDGRLPGALGEGVAQWAQTASATQRHEFGHAVVADVGDSRLGLTVRAGLAAALLSEDLPAEVIAGAGDGLDQRWAAHDGDPDDLTLTAPLSVAVLAGYAGHRRLAFDRLAPANDERLARSTRHWFGVPPRGGWPDGGTALARAFAAAVETGASSPAQGDQQRAALLVSHATATMPDGLLAGPSLSDSASARIAHAYEPYVPSAGDATGEQTLNQCGTTPTPPPAPGIDTDAPLAPSTGLRLPVVQPTLDAFALRDVIAATSRTPAATDVWLGSTDRYAASMLDLATSGDFDVDTNPRASIVQEAVGDIGAVTGAMQADVITDARDRVETRDTIATTTGLAISLATIKSGAAASAGAAAVGGALSFFEPGDPLLDAYDQVIGSEEEMRARYAQPLHDGVVAHDLSLGLPREKAEERAETVAPGDEGGPAALAFDRFFDDMSQTPKDCE